MSGEVPGYIDPAEATRILASFGGIQPPVTRGALDDMSGLHIIHAMEAIQRAAEFEDGTHQNNASHSFNVAVMCMNIGGLLINELGSPEKPFKLERAVSMAVIHDPKEIHAGDTPIDDEELRRTKNQREMAGLSLLLSHLDENSHMAGLIEEYEDGQTPEARFVHAVDKLEAVSFAIRTKAATQRKRNDDFAEIARIQLERTVAEPRVFGLTVYAFKILGRKWHDWGCKPFEGEPDKIIEAIELDLMAARPAAES